MKRNTHAISPRIPISMYGARVTRLVEIASSFPTDDEHPLLGRPLPGGDCDSNHTSLERAEMQ
jgi:hypothetical protein